MRPIYAAEVAQIDIVGTCHLSCANCTRMIGHERPGYFMPLEDFVTALESLEGFPGQIGIMGGEPTLHPEFRKILALLCDYVPLERRALWTSGWKWVEYQDVIAETFLPDLIHYNDHTQEDGKHQPVLVAIQEVVEDEDLMWELIDKCPFQEHWSPVINDRGAFFCEIAGAQDRATNGPGGWPVEPGWWHKKPEDFRGQVERYCVNCSGCLPMPAFSDGKGGRNGPTKDAVSPGMLEKLKAAGSPKALRGHVEVWDKKITREDLESIKDWSPRSFRSFEAHNPDDVKEALG